jgi:diguanylate cyclase (GGDEF)-like protein
MDQDQQHREAGVPGSGGTAVHQIDPRAILSSIGETVYDWDIASDVLTWSGNALSLFGVSDMERLATGDAFSKMLDPISPATRAESILLCDGKDHGGGVAYKLSFAINTARGLTWFEDTGRWFGGADGRAAAAHGVVRRVEGPSDSERRDMAASKFDELTGFYHRAAFIRLMADDITKVQTAKKNAVFLLIAIDDLTFVNRSYGFEAADEVIAGVAQRLKGNIRKKDRCTRYSGTKLGLLLTNFAGSSVDEAVARVMSIVSAEPIRTSAGPIAVKLQIGSVVAPKDGTDPIVLLRRAEEALNDAKLSESKDFVAYTADATRDEARKRNLAASDDVLRALNERRIAIELEPVISAQNRSLQFHEALVRVKAQGGELLGAGAIVPVAERFGLVKYVDIRVLELGVQYLMQNLRQRLSVNVSMRTAVAPEWMTALTALVRPNHGLEDRLIIEVTETAAMADIDQTAQILGRVKDLGLRIAIDDFGSGHTSFRSLRALPVDLLKIDGVFVQNLSRSADDRFFVRTLVDLANHLGVQTVAEWVQDEEAARLLSEWGVTFLQGEFCGRGALAEDTQPPIMRAAG